MAYEELRGKVAIVGAGECDEHGSVPHKSTLQLQAEGLINAVQDAGLRKSDIDGVFTSGTHPAVLAEYVGLKPRYIDGTFVGGASFVILLEHAMLALIHGMCNNAVISHGASGRSRIGSLPGMGYHPTVTESQFELPYGAFGATTQFTLPALRYMKETGTTLENLSEVAVSTRKWASLNPRAVMREPQTISDVLQARMVAYPFTLPMCCLLTDAAGSVVLTTVDRARALPQRPVYILGTGEAVTHQVIWQMDDFTTVDSYQMSGQRTFEMAKVAREDIDVAEFYDAFVHNPPQALEALGFCKKGEGGRFFAGGRTAPGGDFPMNTNGGGLSYTHPGMYGIFIIIEAVRQLQGRVMDLCPAWEQRRHTFDLAMCRQVRDAKIAIVHGPGGYYSASGTAILGNSIP